MDLGCGGTRAIPTISGTSRSGGAVALALSATGGDTWWTAVGPIVMSTLLIRVSGKGLLEKDIGKRRPGYGEYIERTSGFFPLPPKRG